MSGDGVVQKHPLTDTFARQLFVAKHGHTGMTWDQLDDEFGKEEYRRQVARIIEGWWDPDKPLVVLDLANDELWLAAHSDESTMRSDG